MNKKINLKWYLNRFLSMPFMEIPYRINQLFSKLYDRIKTGGFPDRNIIAKNRLDLLNILTLTKDIRLKSMPIHLKNDLKRIKRAADLSLNNRFEIFNMDVCYDEKIDWHSDPLSKKKWPRIFSGNINFRDGKTIGDVKFVWEINRLQILPLLGITYRATKNKIYGEQIFKLIESWLKQNPYLIGVNWTSGIEAGIRTANCLWALSFLEGFFISEKKRRMLAYFFFIHARYIKRYPSKFSSNNNHALVEGLGLFLAGIALAETNETKGFQNAGKKILDREVTRQILPDGGSIECSTPYLSLIFDIFLIYRTVCAKLGISCPATIDQRLEKSCDFITTLMDKNGNIPHIGDDDSAVLVNFGLSSYENFTSLLNTGAILFNRPDLKKTGADIKTWILAASCPGTHHRTALPCSPKTSSPIPESRFFPYSGLAVIRDEFNKKEILLTANGSPLGMPPIYAHGHLDALSITLSIDGTQFITDPGTYLYHSGGKWRRFFRSTEAHSTIRFNKNDYAGQTGAFMFDSPYSVSTKNFSVSHDKTIWEASLEFDDKKLFKTLPHRNIAFYRNNGYFEITDYFNLKTCVPVEQFFHFHPDVNIEIKQNAVILSRNGIKVRMETDDRLEISLANGGVSPVRGWYSNRFNHIEPASTLTCSAILNAGVKLNTAIYIN